MDLSKLFFKGYNSFNFMLHKRFAKVFCLNALIYLKVSKVFWDRGVETTCLVLL